MFLQKCSPSLKTVVLADGTYTKPRFGPTRIPLPRELVLSCALTVVRLANLTHHINTTYVFAIVYGNAGHRDLITQEFRATRT